LRENKSAPIISQNNSLNSEGIQYRILAVLNAQRPLFIG
jgi:hypothetical protein